MAAIIDRKRMLRNPNQASQNKIGDKERAEKADRRWSEGRRDSKRMRTVGWTNGQPEGQMVRRTD